jgi:hypothetical protein
MVSPLRGSNDRQARLTSAEREVVLNFNDEEGHWHAFTDSSRLARRLLAVAARWGVTPQKLGEGYEFELPPEAIRFAAPRRLSEAERRQRRRAAEASRRARFALKR